MSCMECSGGIGLEKMAAVSDAPNAFTAADDMTHRVTTDCYQPQQNPPRLSAHLLLGTSRIDQDNDSSIIFHNACAAVDLGVAFNDQQLGHIAQNCRNCEHKGHKVCEPHMSICHPSQQGRHMK